MSDVVDVKGFGFRYPEAPKWAVQDFDLAAGEGEVLLLAGQSGCGKSTLLRSINGLIPHMYAGEYRGKVTVAGMDVAKSTMRELSQTVGFLFQNPENQIFMFSVERDVAFGLENLGVPRPEMRSRVDEAMATLDIGPLALRAPHELSDGQKQRVALAGVMVMRPKLVILDEPTSLLDPMTAGVLVGTIERLRRELGTTFIVVEHRLDLLVKVADRVVVMGDGRKVLEGSPQEVLADERAEPYGVAVPEVTKLQNGLRKEGRRVGEGLLDPAEMAAELDRL